MMLIDTHAHLDMEAFADDVDDVVARARAAGIGTIVNIAIDPDGIGAVLSLAERYDGCYAAVGIHPHAAGRWHGRLDAGLALLEEACRHPRVVAVGEIGLDFYRDYVPHDVQEEVFRAQIKLAARLSLPIVIHNRQADDDLLRVIDDEVAAGAAGLTGVIHCFSNGPASAAAWIDRGFYLGFGGVLTYPGAKEVRAAAAAAPLERIVVETDAPYLAPQSRRGKRNEPAFVAAVADVLAAVRGMTTAAVAAATTANARRLFAFPVAQR